MSDAPRDHADVITFPPLIVGANLVFGVLLDWFVPLGALAVIPWSVRLVVGAVILAAGILIWFGGLQEFRRTNANINPFEPTDAVVRTGIYARTRNPIYLGGTLALLGIALIFALDWVVILMVPATLLLHYGVVLPEERYLEGKFGDEYRRYKAEVPRYGWRM